MLLFLRKGQEGVIFSQIISLFWNSSAIIVGGSAFALKGTQQFLKPSLFKVQKAANNSKICIFLQRPVLAFHLTPHIRPCLFKMPAVLQIALLKIFRCAVSLHFVSELCIILPDLDVLKIALLETILGVWCAIALVRLKRQGLSCEKKYVGLIKI